MPLLLSRWGWGAWPGCEGSWCPGGNIAGLHWGCSPGTAAAAETKRAQAKPLHSPPFTSAPQSALAMLAWQSKGKRQECWESTEGWKMNVHERWFLGGELLMQQK